MQWHLPRGPLQLDSPTLMGVLNVTPDSFSDGGLHNTPQAAADRAAAMVAQGAHVLDVGGESTRPGAQRIDAAEQIRRVIPVIERVRASQDQALAATPISIDTTLAQVAASALDAGADIINDVSAGEEDEAILTLAARTGAGLVLMHRVLPPTTDVYSHAYEAEPDFGDESLGGGVVASVTAYLQQRIERAQRAGVNHQNIVADPGLGFGKSVRQNYQLVAAMGQIQQDVGVPLLCAASRKSFIGAVTGQENPADRIAGSVAVAAVAYLAGARLFRVHDLPQHAQALAVAQALAKTQSME